jgi:hypothetical protein
MNAGFRRRNNDIILAPNETLSHINYFLGIILSLMKN